MVFVGEGDTAGVEAVCEENRGCACEGKRGARGGAEATVLTVAGGSKRGVCVRGVRAFRSNNAPPRE